MKYALHAEWTKMRTVPGTVWLVGVAVVATVSVGAMAAGTAGTDRVRAALAGVYAGQAVVAVLAVTAMAGEYGTGMIRTSLTAVPRRHLVLAAKAAVTAGVALATSTAAVGGSLLVARLPPTEGPTLRAATGTVLYLVLIALLSLGAATAVRDSAAAVAVVFGVLYALPMLGRLVTDDTWQRRLQRAEPMTAGLLVQHTTDVASLPLPPWAGLGVLAAWSAAALLGGGLLLRLRDA
ncbi:ABC transporter permease [Actinacidiphila alni]|uniref:ABC transporter permease n=1 Tax=Actinacidiphila alni TaxID=380248 RepID=UPI00345663A1